MNSQMRRVKLERGSDEDVAHYAFEGLGRLILDTIHGTVIIDIRRDDVNAFSSGDNRDNDKLLISKQSRSSR